MTSKSDGGFATALIASGLASAALLAPLWPDRGAARLGTVATVLFVGWLLLSLIGGLLLSAMSIGEVAAEGDRYTAKGREATAHWLGVAAWLRSHDALRELPPGAVAVWDRYLAYAAALQVNQHAVRVLDFEAVGHRDLLWSQHTGRRRQVRVKYWRRQRLLRPLGPAPARLRLIWAAVTLPVWLAAGVDIANSVTAPYLRVLLLCLVAVQVVRAAYRLIRSIADLTRLVEVTGTVLDDGSADVLRPWIVNRDIARGRPAKPRPAGRSGLFAWHEQLVRPSFQPGDQVHLTGQGWSRYVTSLRPVRPRLSIPDPSEASSRPAA